MVSLLVNAPSSIVFPCSRAPAPVEGYLFCCVYVATVYEALNPLAMQGSVTCTRLRCVVSDSAVVSLLENNALDPRLTRMADQAVYVDHG